MKDTAYTLVICLGICVLGFVLTISLAGNTEKSSTAKTKAKTSKPKATLAASSSAPSVVSPPQIVFKDPGQKTKQEIKNRSQSIQDAAIMRKNSEVRLPPPRESSNKRAIPPPNPYLELLRQNAKYQKMDNPEKDIESSN